MPCSTYQNAYFNYPCYYRLKEYFDKCNIIDDGTTFLKQYQEPETAKRKIFKPNENLFFELTKRLSGDGLFSELRAGICCKYINYWLNNKISTEYTHLNETDFIVFKDFVDKYQKFRRIGTIYNEKYVNYIQPLLETKKYKRMRILYEMYSTYKQIKAFVDLNTHKNRICDDFNFIIRFYNTLIREHKGDVYLNNRLEFFKDLLVREGDQYNKLCNINLSNLLPKPVIPKPHLKYYTKRIAMLQNQSSSNIEMPINGPPKVRAVNKQKETLPREQREQVKLGATREMESTTETESAAEIEEAEEAEEAEEIKAGKELEEIIGVDLKEMLGREMVGTIKKKLEEELTQKSVDQPQEEDAEQTGDGVVGVQEGLQVDRADIFNGRDSSYIHLPSYTDRTTWQESVTRNHQSESLKDNEGFFGNVKSTFSSIAEHVEPAPILGVSGGMGVLFLLFKYTPVGTMFRGRGNRRRIPGSFGREYPGFMPSFQGHEYGYFPYDQINIAYGPE
ncbi:PIR protein [Plasmodium vivax]|uniref:VIR protein n=1 Tax=Plasmodium vivax TaxID=5855 RepID=A0A564ZQP6_PLAVI|nr:PIR protein [Plasmodium vivax]